MMMQPATSQGRPTSRAAALSEQETPSSGAIGTGEHTRQGDAQLVAAAIAGERAAWNALVERFSNLVWAIARAHRLSSADAVDVSQAVWVKLFENLGRIREASSVGAWLATVTKHECLRLIRHHDRVTPVANVFDNQVSRPVDNADTGLLADERSAALWRAFDRLPPRWRALMQLLMIEPGLSYAEISTTLDMPIGSIGPIRQRCLCRLRTCPELAAVAA
jgi:RNA polymerase sigma factor (sigma-70 family)